VEATFFSTNNKPILGSNEVPNKCVPGRLSPFFGGKNKTTIRQEKLIHEAVNKLLFKHY